MSVHQDLLFDDCLHEQVNDILQHSGPHHAKRVCSKCGKFLGWIPKPETIERRKENDRILTALAKINPRLTEWERGFIRDVTSHKNLSPRQQDIILLLNNKYLTKGPNAA